MIEVRNVYPSNNATNISRETLITFDLVALNDYTIDITSLEVSIETESKIIDGEVNTLNYSYSDTAITTSGSNPHYTVAVKPEIPFDEGQTATVAINVSGTDDDGGFYLMEEFEFCFSTSYSGVISDFRYAFINATERIPVYNEILRKNSTTAPQVFDSAFNQWNDDKFLKVRVNQVLVESGDATYGYTIDKDKGVITFNSALDYNDTVDASYTFRFFTEEEIESFFKMAAAQWNMAPPFGGPRDIYSASATVQGVLMVGASLFAFRELLMRLAIQEQRIIFDNASWGDGWIQVKELFKTLHDANKDMWEKSLEAKKLKLAHLAVVSTPAYTLPGGRTFCYAEMCDIGNGNFINFDTMYNMFLDKRSVSVKVLNSDGRISYNKVSAIEYEGKKQVYTVVLSSGKGNNFKTKKIKTSLDHKYETPRGMKRLFQIKIGEKIIVSNNNKREEWLLTDVGSYGVTDCYEIEVPQSGKFLCNDISVSNSRMFRYLYKSPGLG